MLLSVFFFAIALFPNTMQTARVAMSLFTRDYSKASIFTEMIVRYWKTWNQFSIPIPTLRQNNELAIPNIPCLTLFCLFFFSIIVTQVRFDIGFKYHTKHAGLKTSFSVMRIWNEHRSLFHRLNYKSIQINHQIIPHTDINNRGSDRSGGSQMSCWCCRLR